MRLSGRDFNSLLVQHGYLTGAPGAYSVTEKGEFFAHEKDEFRGNPRSMAYSTSWTERSWDESILDELKRKIADGLSSDDAALASDDDESPDGYVADDGSSSYDDREPRPQYWKALAVGVAMTGLAVIATDPRVQEWVRDNVQPRATRLWRKVRRSERADGPAVDDVTSRPVAGPDADETVRDDGATEPDGPAATS